MEEFEIVKLLTDDELVVRVSHCVREDRRVSAQLLAHLGEIEARGLYRDLGYESMFEYAVRALHMSDSEAGLRLHAARFARKFPASLEMLSRGELHLTAMKLLAPVLKAENAELLKMSCLKTKQEIQQLIAKHCPQPDAPDAIRRLPTPQSVRTTHPELMPRAGGEGGAAPLPTQLAGNGSAASGSPPTSELHLTGLQVGLSHHESHQAAHAAQTQLGHSLGDGSAEVNTQQLPAASVTPACNREPAVPISEGRYKIVFTAGRRVRDLLQEAQDLFRNQVPNGDIEVLVERALGLLVSERKKELYAQTDKPRHSSTATAPSSKPRSRHIASETKRRVYLRDEGQCRFVSATGERCCARSRLEFHHVHAFGLGGAATEENIVLFCHAHNALLAERDFSREHIQRCIRARQAARAEASTARTAHSKAGLTSTYPTNSNASKQTKLSMPQHKPTRSGTFGPHERSAGVNQPRARKAE